MRLIHQIRVGSPYIFRQADIICDKVPFLSTLTNIIDLIAKGILQKTGTTPSLLGVSWSEHISQKPIWKCLLLCIPVVGNLIVYMIPRENRTQEMIDQLFGISIKSLPELKISKDEDALDPKLLTSPIMRGQFADGRQFVALHLQHQAQPCSHEQDKWHNQLHPECTVFETVYAIAQRSLKDLDSWFPYYKYAKVEPGFFGGEITDSEEGYVRGFEKKYYDLLQKVVKNGSGSDRNDQKWAIVNYDQFKTLKIANSQAGKSQK